MSDFAFMLDTADKATIQRALDFFPVAGVTTNPTHVCKVLKARNIVFKDSQDKFKAYVEVLGDIASITKVPISAEVVSVDEIGMLAEANILKSIASNIVIKLPTTKIGLKVCGILSETGVKTNLTLCFTAAQAFLAASFGATYVSPFIGRIDDIGLDGMHLIKDIKQIYNNYSCKTKILAASVRNIVHVIEALRLGVDAITGSLELFESLYKHPLTDRGCEIFSTDWGF